MEDSNENMKGTTNEENIKFSAYFNNAFTFICLKDAIRKIIFLNKLILLFTIHK